MAYYILDSNELIHYGVKGMKWGVRKDKGLTGNKYYKNGKLTAQGVKKYKNIGNYNREYKYDKMKKAILITAGVSAAVVLGTMAWRRGVTYGDKILKAGTLVQNIAPRDRTFETSFYGAVNKKDRQFFLRQFTVKDRRDMATLFKAEKDIKIAGKGAMNKAYNEMKGVKISKISDRNNFYRGFGALDEPDRQKFISILEKKGYNGFKDYNDIMIDWADTPVVFFGDKSGLAIKTQSIVNVDKARALRVKNSAGKRKVASLLSGGTLAVAIPMADSIVNVEKDKTTMAYNRHGKSYKELTRKEKWDILRDIDSQNYKKGDRGSKG